MKNNLKNTKKHEKFFCHHFLQKLFFIMSLLKYFKFLKPFILLFYILIILMKCLLLPISIKIHFMVVS